MADKFESQDLPKILLALKTAKESKCRSQVLVSFDSCGGVLSVVVEMKQVLK